MAVDGEAFDYVIIGAGSAGCVLAERLSVDGRTRVLVLEAGGTNDHPLIHMPKGMAKLIMSPKHTWFLPVVQPRVEGEAANEVWVRGLGLGGSSSLNGMIYSRGQPADYEDWAALGATGWGWSTMKAAFRAIEDHELGDDGTRGAGGPVHVAAGSLRYPLSEKLIEAGEQMGLPRHEELNREDLEGVGYYAHNIHRGRRQSAATVFLKPAMRRRNVEVVTEALTDRIVFEQGRAIAVEAIVGGVRKRFGVAGEVIVAAGALMSPAILQRSGIGPAATLRAAGVTPIVDSRDVGERMRDHLGFTMTYRLKGDRGINHVFRGAGLVGSVLRYYLRRDGPLATGPFEVGAFVRTRPGVDRPDAQLYLGGVTFARSDDDNFPAALADVEKKPGMTCYGQLLSLTSEGSVRIGSSDPRTLPEIRPNWLTTPEDEATAVAMLRYMRRYLEQPAVAPFLAEETFPGARYQTDEQLLDMFRRMSTCGTHAVASCRMGSDNAAVVDPDLRVNGVAGVRVVDCSVMPAPVSGNTNAPAMALAWAAASRIRSSALA